MMIAWKNFRRKLSAFGADQRGNIALTFLVVALPVIAFVGAAVDYSRANSVKASMQSALDATALLMSKEAATDTDTQRKARRDQHQGRRDFRPEQQLTNRPQCHGGSAGRIRESPRV
jgi:Flp pilus assembly protein TadG